MASRIIGRKRRSQRRKEKFIFVGGQTTFSTVNCITRLSSQRGLRARKSENEQERAKMREREKRYRENEKDRESMKKEKEGVSEKAKVRMTL